MTRQALLAAFGALLFAVLCGATSDCRAQGRIQIFYRGLDRSFPTLLDEFMELRDAMTPAEAARALKRRFPYRINFSDTGSVACEEILTQEGAKAFKEKASQSSKYSDEEVADLLYKCGLLSIVANAKKGESSFLGAGLHGFADLHLLPVELFQCGGAFLVGTAADCERIRGGAALGAKGPLEATTKGDRGLRMRAKGRNATVSIEALGENAPAVTWEFSEALRADLNQDNIEDVLVRYSVANPSSSVCFDAVLTRVTEGGPYQIVGEPRSLGACGGELGQD